MLFFCLQILRAFIFFFLLNTFKIKTIAENKNKIEIYPFKKSYYCSSYRAVGLRDLLTQRCNPLLPSSVLLLASTGSFIPYIEDMREVVNGSRL